jgi:predicted permease
MDLFIISLESVAALLGIGILGYWIIRRHVISENLMGFLAPLALDIALPSLVFISIVLQFNPADFPDWWKLPLIWIGFTVVLFALVMGPRFSHKKRQGVSLPSAFSFRTGLLPYIYYFRSIRA